jgi:hypothetical protein
VGVNNPKIHLEKTTRKLHNENIRKEQGTISECKRVWVTTTNNLKEVTCQLCLSRMKIKKG